MANTNSNIVTALAAARTDGSAALDGKNLSGILLYARGKVTCPATPTVNDTLTLLPVGVLPPGAVLEPVESWVFCESDPGTALNLDIGPTSDPDGIADNLALTVAGLVGFAASGTIPEGIKAPIELAQSEAIVAKIVTSTAVDATVIQFQIAYRVSA